MGTHDAAKKWIDENEDIWSKWFTDSNFNSSILDNFTAWKYEIISNSSKITFNDLIFVEELKSENELFFCGNYNLKSGLEYKIDGCQLKTKKI